MKTIFILSSLLAFLSASAQDNKDFTYYLYQDSLIASSPKDPNGRIFKDGQLEFKKEGRFYLYMVSLEFNVYVLIKTPSGKWIAKSGVTGSKSKDFYGNSGYSFAEIDTTLDEDGKYTFYFTTMTPGKMGKFSIQLVFAPKESLYADSQEKDFCKQIAFLYKHADIGFRFLRNGNTRYEDSKGLLGYYYYNSLVPFEWYKDYNQRVERITSLDYYKFNAKIFLGTYDESKTKYNDLKEQLKKCLGEGFVYEEKPLENGNVIFSATMKEPDRFIIKTWAAWRKDVKFRIELSLYRYADEPQAARILLEFANEYENME